MSEYLVKQVEGRGNIEVRLNSEVIEVEGEDTSGDGNSIRVTILR